MSNQCEQFNTKVKRAQAENRFDEICDMLHALAQMLHTRPNKKVTKTNGLTWLAERLQIPRARMQFRFLTVDECDRVILILDVSDMGELNKWVSG